MGLQIRKLINETQTTAVNETDIDSSDIKYHTAKLYLLLFDLIIFILFTYLSYQSYQKFASIKSPGNETPEELNSKMFRMTFIKGLVLANGSNHSGDDFSAWLNYLAHAIPAFMFLSTYMGLIIIISEIYYSSINFQNHLVKPTLLMVTAVSNILLVIVALATLVTKAYLLFGYLAELLIGIGYCFISLSFLYYGDKLAEIVKVQRDDISERNRKKQEQLSYKIWLFSITMGGFFIIKSLFSLLSAFGAFDDLHPTFIGVNLWDFLMFLITEIAPTSLFIIIAKYAKGSSNQTPETDTPRDSKIREMSDFEDRVSYTPPVAK